MRRVPATLFVLTAVTLVAAGCGSSHTTASSSTFTESPRVRLAGGDHLGQRLHRESTSLAVVATTPTETFANVDTSSLDH